MAAFVDASQANQVDWTRLRNRLPELRDQYRALEGQHLSLDLTRGKPSAAQLDLSEELLSLPGAGHTRAEDGTDVRNYGGSDGLPELRAIFAELYGVAPEQLLALGNSTLNLMHDCLMFAMLHGVPGSPRPWDQESALKFICPVPGYDRHFTLCERLGIEMIPVPMTATGPDVATIRDLVAKDPAIKGMWLVPTYANPSGDVTSPEVARELLSMPTAAPDFRIFWDDAYALHHLTPDELPPVGALALALQEGHPNRVLLFASTSKMTFAGSGVAFFAANPDNLDWFRHWTSSQTIGPDKVNHLRHAMFFGSADEVREHMRKHREILAPKFAAMDAILNDRLNDPQTGAPGIATWTKPKGGYFISLNLVPGLAARVVELAKEAGVALTPAGSTWPHGRDPHDANIRLAPSMPSLPEVETATNVLATCVLLAAAEHAAMRAEEAAEAPEV